MSVFLEMGAYGDPLCERVFQALLLLYFQQDGDLRFFRLAAEAYELASAACELALA